MAKWESKSKSLVARYSSETVKIHAGLLDKTTFTIHKDLLCARSEYFRGAFKGSFKEAKKKEMMVKTTPEIFARFVDWVYGGSFEIDAEDESDGLYGATKAYIFADKYECSEFRRHVLNQIIEHSKTPIGFPWDAIRLAFQFLPENSGLRKYIKGDLIHRWVPEGQDEIRGLLKIPAPVATEIIFHKFKNDNSRSSSKDVFPGDWCQYHEHKDEEETKACKAGGCSQHNMNVTRQESSQAFPKD